MADAIDELLKKYRFTRDDSIILDNYKGAFASTKYLNMINLNKINRDNDLAKTSYSILKDYSENEKREIKLWLNELGDDDDKFFTTIFNEPSASSRFDAPTGLYLTSFIYSLLKVKDNDVIMDLGSGDGSTLVELYNLSKQDSKKITGLYGIEINQRDADISRLLLAIYNKDNIKTEILSGDALKNQPLKYTKGYVYPPIGQQRLFRSSDFASLLYPNVNFNISFYEQWIFVDRLLYGLEGEDARAVALLFGKSLLQSDRNTFLQKLIDDGWVEGIIELPHGTLPGVYATPYVVVFSKNNSAIKTMVVSGDRNSVIDLDKVAATYFEGKEGCVLVSNEKAKTLRYLTPSNLIVENEVGNQEGYINLNSVADISVGIQQTTANFKDGSDDSDYYILTSSDIEDGVINWSKLRRVNVDKPLYDKYLLSKNDVIVTTKSTKVKVAVADQTPNGKVIVTGGMIIVRPHTDKLNPYYLKLYLDSSEGVALLKTMQTGTTIINMSPRLFMNVKIPNTDISIQNKKANRYLDKVSSINASRERINKLQEEISHILDEEDE